MIPYNPSSFNTNKTILEQILELKNWLKDHPSYRVFMSTANGNDSMPDTYNLSDILDDADQLNVGDVVLFSNGCVGSVSSLDVDNQTFDCNLPCVSIKGPQGPRGYTGKGISNAQVDASGDLEITIFDPATSTSTTTNVGHVKGADGTNGTNGTDGAYVSSASVDASGDLQITIYDPATSTSSVVNAGHVVGADGQGIQIIDVTTTTGTLSASDLAKVTGTDDCTINYTSANGTISFKRLFWDSAYAYFTGVYVETDTYYCVTEVEIATGVFNIDISPLPIKDSNINSGSATNGQVLTANGSGGASWQNASGGVEVVQFNDVSSSGTFTGDDLTKIASGDVILFGTQYYRLYRCVYKNTSGNSVTYICNKNLYSVLRTYILDVNTSTGAWTITDISTRDKQTASNIDSQSATNGQVLTANGSGGASWQNAGGSFTHYATITGNSGTLSQDDYDKLLYNDSVLVKGNYVYHKNLDDSSRMWFINCDDSNFITLYAVTKATRYYVKDTHKLKSSGINSAGATSGQVLTADGNDGASWQNAGGGSQLYAHHIRIASVDNNLKHYDIYMNIINSSSTAYTGTTLRSYLYNNYTRVANGYITENDDGTGAFYNVISIYANASYLIAQYNTGTSFTALTLTNAGTTPYFYDNVETL